MAGNVLKRLFVEELSLSSLILSAIFVYVVSLFLALYYADRLIFYPQPASYRDNSTIIKLTASDGLKISALYLPNEKADYTILYSHGNAEDLGDILPWLERLRCAGFAVFAYDYHGYGTSEGKPTERNSYRDIDAAYDYLTGQLKVPPQRIIAHGYSVGGGPAVDLAARRPLAGLILESSFITAFRVVTRIPLSPFDCFRNIDKIKKAHVPVLVIHGSDDRVVPVSHGERLFKEAGEPKRFLRVAGADHMNLREVAGNRYEEALRDFARLIAMSVPLEFDGPNK